jgi:hypothetical protein
LRKAFRYSLILLGVALYLAGSGILLRILFGVVISNSDAIILPLSFYMANAVCLFVFFAGQEKENKSQAFYTLISISLKFLIELIIALVWFLIAKKTSISFILLFFVLYLSFTLFFMLMLLKTLRNKSL